MSKVFAFSRKHSQNNENQNDTKMDDLAKKHFDEDFAEGMSFEVLSKELLIKDVKRAWKTCFFFGVGFVLSVLAIVLMLPLKTEVPYLVRVDNTTGRTDIVNMLAVETTNYGEVVDKRYLHDYVINRESYDWWTVKKTHKTTQLMSAPAVAAEYTSKFNLDDEYQNKFRVDVEVLSVTLRNMGGDNIATVRYQKTLRQTDGGGYTVREVSNWIATVGYRYQNKSVMKEEDRMLNPLAFEVLSWRTEKEANVPVRVIVKEDAPARPEPSNMPTIRGLINDVLNDSENEAPALDAPGQNVENSRSGG